MKSGRILVFLVVASALLASPLYAGVGILKGDTYVSSTNPSANFGSTTVLNVGNGNSALVQFDLSPLLSNQVTGLASANATPFIGKATLTVFVSKAAAAGTLNVTPALSAWTESTVTFSTAPAAGSFAESAAVSAGGQFVQIDITPFVQGWLNNNNDPSSQSYVGGGNFGLLLSSPDGGVFVLDSKEGTATSHQAELNVELATNFTGVLKKNMSLASPGFTSLFSILLSGTEVAGGRVYYTIRATDGGSQIATEEGIIQFDSTTNSITCTVQTADKLHLGLVNSGCTPGFFSPGLHPGISIFDNVSFSSPAPIVVHEVTFHIDNVSGAAIRLEP